MSANIFELAIRTAGEAWVSRSEPRREVGASPEEDGAAQNSDMDNLEVRAAPITPGRKRAAEDRSDQDGGRGGPTARAVAAFANVLGVKSQGVRPTLQGAWTC